MDPNGLTGNTGAFPSEPLIVRALLVAAIVASLLSTPAHAAAPPGIDHVIIVSIDGLRSDALLAVSRTDLPILKRLCTGASTLNARTTATLTVTLPNHTSMITGRPISGPRGHAWTANDWSVGDADLHGHREAYLPSIFDVAHDHGVFTGLFVTKSKLALFDLSFDASHGRPDAIGADDGPDKIDAFHYASSADLEPELCAAETTDAVIAALDGGAARSLLLVHYRNPDSIGHAHGWDLTRGSPYLASIADVDRELARIMTRIDGSDRLRGRTAVIVTTDHGGGAPYKSHDRPEMWVNYIIPFIVWTEDGAGADLYALNPWTRAEPGLARPGNDQRPGPIRNGEAGNVALDLLGLPPVQGSTLNGAHDLRVR